MFGLFFPLLEPLAQHFRGDGEAQEGVGVVFFEEQLELDLLARSEQGDQHVTGIGVEAAAGVEDRHAAVQRVDDVIAHQLRFAGDDHGFFARGEGPQVSVHDQRRDVGQQQSVDDVLDRHDPEKQQDHGEVQQHRNVAQLHARFAPHRDAHDVDAAGRTAAGKHRRQRDAVQHGRDDDQQHTVGDDRRGEAREKFHAQRHQDGGVERPVEKALGKHLISEKEKREVEHGVAEPQRNAAEVVEEQADAHDARVGQHRRLDEKDGADAVKQGADGGDEKSPQFLFQRFGRDAQTRCDVFKHGLIRSLP